MPDPLPMTEVEVRVIRAIGKVARDREVLPDSTFEGLNLDSFAMNEVLFEIEEEFDIDIPNEGIRSIRSVRCITLGIVRLLAGEAPDFGGHES